MPCTLITGANRGIGLAMTEHYLQHGWQVHACCRRPDAAAELQDLARRFPLLAIHCLDVSDFQAIDHLALSLGATPIDLLINNAGIYGDPASQRPGHIDYDSFTELLRVNTLAPVKLTEALLPQLRLGKRRLVVSLSSLMGSIADNTSGGSIAYRTSKSALNAAMKTLAKDLEAEDINVVILHPGWVKTAMGGPNAPTPVHDSVEGLTRLIASLGPEHRGRFFNFRSEELAW